MCENKKTKHFLYIPTELEEPHFGAVTRIKCTRVNVLHEQVRSRNEAVMHRKYSQLKYKCCYLMEISISFKEQNEHK